MNNLSVEEIDSIRNQLIEKLRAANECIRLLEHLKTSEFTQNRTSPLYNKFSSKEMAEFNALEIRSLKRRLMEEATKAGFSIRDGKLVWDEL